METLRTNKSGTARRVRHDGRDYLVAPVTLLVPGVLNGSNGPLLYPPDEVAKDPSIWNGVPLTNGHPSDPATDRPVSGRDPETYERVGLGHVYRVKYDDTRNRLRGEAWFDEARTKRVAPAVYNALTTGGRVEVSTGLFTKNTPVSNGVHSDGRSYAHVAREYKADHLAVLTGVQGACSVADGCGVNNANPEGCNQHKPCGGGSGNPAQKSYPHLSHLLNGADVHGTHGSKAEAMKAAKVLRAGGTFSSILPDPKGGKGAKFLVTTVRKKSDQTTNGLATKSDTSRSLLRRIAAHLGLTANSDPCKSCGVVNCGGKGGKPGPCKGWKQAKAAAAKGATAEDASPAPAPTPKKSKAKKATKTPAAEKQPAGPPTITPAHAETLGKLHKAGAKSGVDYTKSNLAGLVGGMGKGALSRGSIEVGRLVEAGHATQHTDANGKRTVRLAPHAAPAAPATPPAAPKPTTPTPAEPTTRERRFAGAGKAFRTVVKGALEGLGRAMATNANPEGCNQYKGCGVGGGSGDAKSIKKEISSHRKEMKEQGIRETSFMNGGLSAAESKANEKLFELRTKLGQVASKGAGSSSHAKEFLSSHDVTPEGYTAFGPATRQATVEKYNKQHKTKLSEEDFHKLVRNVSESRKGKKKMTRNEAVTLLTTNCDCWKGKAETLNALDTETLAGVLKQFRAAQAAEAGEETLNALAAELGVERAELTVNAIPELMMKGKKKKTKCHDDGDEEIEGKEDMETNGAKTLKPASSTLSPEDAAVVNWAKGKAKKERDDLLDRLTANAEGDAKKSLRGVYNKLNLDELETLASALPESDHASTGNEYSGYGRQNPGDMFPRKQPTVRFGPGAEDLISDARTDNKGGNAPEDDPNYWPTWNADEDASPALVKRRQAAERN